MKKIKILSHPVKITTIQLSDLDYNIRDESEERLVRSQIKKWRRLRHVSEELR
jgi:hypothetical protein